MSRRGWALSAVLVFAVAARLYLAASRPLVYDEYPWIRIADSVSLLPPSLPVHGSDQPPGGAWVAGLGRLLLGPNVVGYRLGAVALGVLLVVCGWRTASLAWGARAGLIAAALLASNEYLLGVSVNATEKCYLGWALLSLCFFGRALKTRGDRDFAIAGAAFGAALLTKYTVALWAPVYAFELARRRGAGALFTRGPALFALACAALVAPDIVWHLASSRVAAGPGAGGLAYQAGRLGWGLAEAPLSLFLSPLQSRGPDIAVSEYATMSLGAGFLLLGSGLLSLWRSRDPDSRFLQRLGFVPLAFFTLLGSGRSPELWWTDLSVPAFALLAANLLGSRPSPIPAVLAVAVTLAGTPDLLSARENCYPPDLRVIPALAMQRCQEDQRAFVARFRDRDHVALSYLAGVRLPVADFYQASLGGYEQWLASPVRGTPHPDGWPEVPSERVAEERRWVERELSRLRPSR